MTMSKLNKQSFHRCLRRSWKTGGDTVEYDKLPLSVRFKIRLLGFVLLIVSIIIVVALGALVTLIFMVPISIVSIVFNITIPLTQISATFFSMIMALFFGLVVRQSIASHSLRKDWIKEQNTKE